AWLRSDVLPHARGATKIGPEAFARLLRVRRIGADAAAIAATGERVIARETARVHDLAVTVLASRGREPGAEPVAHALAAVREDRPADFAAVLATYDEAIAGSRAFVVDRGLATAPDVPLRVVETPAYLRHLIPFAAYLDPGRWSPRPEGVYLVTPKVDLAAFPRAEVRTTTVHEAWPGHHLQLSVARSIPLGRFLAGATEYIEGWALYCEDLMLRHGFLTTPEERFVQAKDSLWRALRIRLDVGLATGTIPFEAAVAQLVDALGFSEAEARAEAKRYTLEPGYNLSYMWGKLAFLDLRERWVASGRVDERTFHDRVLAAGALPFPLLERALEA
ncbi:MAG TPA: DUF885 domain-containing protein, partial [Candidatus Thermoplasmatota archaeon]|nr:DUF885 domain-containing protein [Candidatus Thermoplasmatota archaeon]